MANVMSALSQTGQIMETNYFLPLYIVDVAASWDLVCHGEQTVSTRSRTAF